MHRTKTNVEYVYVSGPYSQGDVAQNIRTAIQAATALLDEGYTPYVPHLTHFWHLVEPQHYDTWIDYDFRWLQKCDALVQLPGLSPGADREVEEAERLKIPVYYGVDDFMQDQDIVGY